LRVAWAPRSHAAKTSLSRAQLIGQGRAFLGELDGLLSTPMHDEERRPEVRS
jgi:hypothetical protein